MIFLGFLKPVFFLLKFWYGWKDLIKSFPTSVFLDFLELWLIYYEFSKFSTKIDFSEFFNDQSTAAAGIQRGERQLVVGTNDRRLLRGNHLEPNDDMVFDN